MLSVSNRRPNISIREGSDGSANLASRQLVTDPKVDNPRWHQLATRLQAKLNVSAPGDPYERQADAVAETVMRMPTSSIVQTKCAPCQHESDNVTNLDPEDETLRPKKESEHATALVNGEMQSHIENLRSGGQPLSESDRVFFEPRFGLDFSHVRVDTSQAAGETARTLNAKAYTLGNYIAFAPGQYSPGTECGDRLLAHELTHTVQQGSTTSVRRRRLSAFDETDEELIKRRGVGHTLQRQPADETLEEQIKTNTERGAEIAWSTSSPGIIEQEKPGEKFLMMNFEINKTTLKKEHSEFLTNTVYFGTLTSDPMASIEIVGHADATGSNALNDRLSRNRAQEVETFLRKLGAHNLRIKPARGRGERTPLASNDTVFGRARNRRVEILVTPWKPQKPVPEMLAGLQKGMKPFVVKMDNFAACPFRDTVKIIVEDAFKPVRMIQFDWDGKSASAEAFISIDDTTTFTTALGLTGDIFLNSFRNNEICKTPGDPTTCEKVFPPTADVMGRAIANTIAHETGHAFALDHVPGTDNLMWSPELHSLFLKTNKTFDEKVLLQRTLQSVPETFNDSQLVHIVNRIKEQRKRKPGVVDFE